MTTFTYNNDGQVVTQTNAMNHVTSYQYDDFGELVQETLPSTAVLHWSFDADGNEVSYEDGLAHTTTYAFNDRNWKTSQTDPLSGVTHFGYDNAGNMTSLQDPAGNTTAFAFDGLNREISDTNQLGATRSFVYDLNGNLIQETDRDGRVRDFSYDHLNRQTAEQWMSGGTVLETISYAYNADGQLTSAASPDNAYAYAYDGEGRTASVDNNGTPNVPDVVLSDQYDANGNRTQLSATIAGTADFQNVYSYDALNRLTQLYQQGQTGGNAVAVKGANLTYNLLGQLSTIARTNFFGVGPAPDIATSTFSYDTANRLTQIAYTTGGTPIDAYSWAYDLADRVTSMTTTTDGTATYSYDDTNQVTGATYTTNPGATQPANESYSYDSNGNRTNTGYTTGTNNQLTSDGTFNYAYDAEGNRTSRTRISNNPANDYKTTYTWDYRDRLTDVKFYNNSNVLTKHVHYTYDVFDHLIGKQVDDTGGGTYDRAEFYVYDGNYVVLQFGLGGALTERYLSGPSASGVDTVLAEEDVTSLTSPGTVTWPLTDNLGTVRDIVDSTGAVIDHLVDNSFGQLAYESAPTVHHLQGYTGAIYDPDTGMTNNWRRWYDPAVGRWISEDPMGFAAGDANLSRYVGNSPVTHLDWNGLSGYHITTGGGDTYEGTGTEDFLEALQTIQENEDTILMLILKGHGCSPDGGKKGGGKKGGDGLSGMHDDDNNWYIQIIEGSIGGVDQTVFVVLPDGEMVPLLPILRDITGPGSEITLRGCSTWHAASWIGGALSNGTQVTGTLGPAFNIPWTWGIVSIWNTYPPVFETPAP